jgi:pimeloyl-ACP methyl ester carboxylesterase
MPRAHLRPPRVRRATTLALAIVTSVTVATAAIPAGAAPAAQPRAHTGTGSLAWDDCGDGFECAVLDVPVDHSTADGEHVGIAVIRAPASDPGQRIGSLVVNFGGPGDPGTETLRRALDIVPAAVRARFDVVSFDPRGTGASRPIDCVDDATFDRLWSEDATPDSDADLPAFYDGTTSSVDFTAACIQAQGQWLAQVGTRNVARDVELLRRALGDAKLTFLGYSYGTVIGAVYAQLSPRKVRALVLDGAVNLSIDAHTEQEGHAAGFEGALDEFLADCATRTECEFHSGGDPRGALTALRDRFELGLTLPTDDGRTAGVSELYTTLLAALYAQDDWQTLAQTLAAADDGDGTYLRLITDLYTGRQDDGSYNNYHEALGIISCDDRRDAKPSFEDYTATYERLRAAYPFFGPVLAGQPTGCDPRLPAPPPGEDLGDVRSTKAPPALIIGTTRDPATPYAGARDLKRRLRGSRLLTYDGTEHGGYGRGHACVDDAVDAYLIDLALPARGTRCEA